MIPGQISPPGQPRKGSIRLSLKSGDLKAEGVNRRPQVEIAPFLFRPIRFYSGFPDLANALRSQGRKRYRDNRGRKGFIHGGTAFYGIYTLCSVDTAKAPKNRPHAHLCRRICSSLPAELLLKSAKRRRNSKRGGTLRPASPLFAGKSDLNRLADISNRIDCHSVVLHLEFAVIRDDDPLKAETDCL